MSKIKSIEANNAFKSGNYKDAVLKYIEAQTGIKAFDDSLKLCINFALKKAEISGLEEIVNDLFSEESINKLTLALGSTLSSDSQEILKITPFEGLDEYTFNEIAKSELFDPQYYASQLNKDSLPSNLLKHYLNDGIKEGLNPSKSFDTKHYLKVNPDVADAGVNPFIHYVLSGINEHREALPKKYISRYEVAPIEYVPRLSKNAEAVKKAVRVICFYLPQFHPIPENDEWWGKGFTEWTNVKPAKPQFDGHYQPHIPHKDIGYYSLLDKVTQLKQIELAKQYGIEGFCYYLYWFSGQRLLEQPLDNMLKDPSIDFPFCVCWANENWSRRWDGLENDLLMVQNYSEEDDLAFIQNIAKYLKDPRYIKIDNKPLLLVYRPNLFPDMKATATRWRDWCRDNGLGEIYLAYPQSFESADPAEYFFDAAIEFPPNKSNPPRINDVEPIVDDFQTTVYDWRVLVERSDEYIDPGYKLFRSATPSWDNTARKKNKGTVFENSCPKLFTKYLINAFSETLVQFNNKDERFVFINAWNEWAEGAHLEPDERYGYAWLQSVYDAHKVASQKNDRHPSIYEVRWNKINYLFKQDISRNDFNFLADYEKLLQVGHLNGIEYEVVDTTPFFIRNGRRHRLSSRSDLFAISDEIFRLNIFSFVVLQYNKSDLTIECVKSLKKLDDNGFRVEIVVVDNGSEKQHLANIEKEFAKEKNVHVIKSNNNKGFAGGNNIGFNYAKNTLNSSFCAVINNDTVIKQKDFIVETISYFKQYSFSVLGPDVIVSSTRHENPWNDCIYSLAEFKELRDLRFKEMNRFLAGEQPAFSKIGKSTPSNQLIFNPLLQGAAYVFSPIFMQNRNQVFDERLFLYGEEFLLATDCISNGELCIYTNEIYIEHHEGSTTDELPPQDKLMLGYESSLKALDYSISLLERKHAAFNGKYISKKKQKDLNELVLADKNNILLDLFFCQPGYHGAGEYGKAVFKKMVEEYITSARFELWCALDPDLFIDDWVWDFCRSYAINIIEVKNYNEIIDIVNKDLFTTFFTPAIVVYSGYEYMQTVGSKMRFTTEKTRIVGTLHDIRDYEISLNYKDILNARKKIGCINELKLSKEDESNLLEKHSANAEQLKAMYQNIISDPRVELITISKYCEKSIIKNVGTPTNEMKVLMSPMKPRPEPMAPPNDPHGLSGKVYALLLHASRLEKNAASAVKAFDELISEGSIDNSIRIVLTGLRKIEHVGLLSIKNPNNFVCVGELAPEHLEFYLKNTALLVYPSLNEGLGYPPIEAMSYNTPCAVSNVTAIPEVCEDAVAYFNPYDIKSIKETLKQCLTCENKQTSLNRYKQVKLKQEEDLDLLADLLVAKKV